MTHFNTFIGLDVGKEIVSVFADSIKQPFEIKNDGSGFDHLIHCLEQSGMNKATSLLVLEPTGGYETRLWVNLCERGYIVRRVDAKQVRHFAKAHGLLAKNDAIDARLLRDYACTFPDRGQLLTDENQRYIKALINRRSTLVDMRKAVRCRLKQVTDAKLTDMDKELEKTLSRQIKNIETTLDNAVKTDAQLHKKTEYLRSIPGIGPVLAWMCLAHMPELGVANNNQIAALAGVAPFAHDSGKNLGKRFVQLGRKAFRNVLYQAALVASKHNPDLKKFATRLKLAGKPHKLIITAVARKLIVLANTIISKNRKWEPAV